VRCLTPSKRCELGEAAQRKIADHYTWPGKARQIIAIISRFANPRNSSRQRFTRGSTSTLIVISLAASSLPYASLCVRSLAENLDGVEAIHLLTDTPSDQEQLQRAFGGLGRIKVQLSDELWRTAAIPCGNLPGWRASQGHPCWRKADGPDAARREGTKL